MKNKGVFIIIFITLIVFNVFLIREYTHAKAPKKNANIEVLINGVDDVPKVGRIGESVKFEEHIEMWHSSGGYWIYEDIIINDSDLKKDLTDEDALADAIKGEFVFEYKLDSKLYERLTKTENLKVVCSTTLKDPVTEEYKTIDNIFYEKPSIELKNGKVYFKGKPKLNFYTEDRITYSDIIGDLLNVQIPLVDPDYGMNLYAIWSRNPSDAIGGAWGYFNKDDPFATPDVPTVEELKELGKISNEESYKSILDIPNIEDILERQIQELGAISPSQIKDSSGHLQEGFKLIAGGKVCISDESSVGSGTFIDGGAVGLIFYYPIVLTFYAAADDLSANFEEIPSGAVEGDEVLVSVVVNSTFEEEITTSYEWEITNKNGDKINTKFLGSVSNRQGKVTIPAGGETLFYASFTMPNSDVRIQFKINEDGQEPLETYLDNNILDSESFAIKLVERYDTVGEFDLPYNALSRKLRFPLANGKDITAKLNLPKGSWDGRATGSLDIDNTTPSLFKNFKPNKISVNEDSTEIVLNPNIEMAIYRTSFEDDPQNRKWLDWTNPWEPKVLSGKIEYGGSVRRNYKYREYTSADDEEGKLITSTTSAPFNSGTDTKNIKAYIYNGRETILPKSFNNKIENNEHIYLQKKLFWQSEPYPFNVIRWMCHIDENGREYGWTAVDGQYKRTFIQQNSADIKVEQKSSMTNEYYQGRDAAAKGINQKSLYDKAVFATDKELQRFDYPIKSGYYFNPAGEYKITVETVTHKPVKGKTKDHENLVNALINSFRYETDLIYITDGREAVNINNKPIRSIGGKLQKEPAIMSMMNNQTVNGMNLLTVNTSYKSDFKEIAYSSVSGGYTHDYWKEILEGYSESGTLASRDNFKYREYIKDGQSMYEITEITEITIKVNKDNINLYTHAHMPDGEYYIRVWMEDINLANANFTSINNAYNSLGTLKGIVPLDEINITVKGSMYDDTN